MMIDSHCHFDFSEFDSDREEVWQRANEGGVTSLLIPGTEAQYFPRIQGLASRYLGIYYGLGLHPWFIADNVQEQVSFLLSALDKAKTDAKLVAIGETGLDFAIAVDRKIQCQLFEKHLELAQQTDLPVIVHHRKSHNEIIRLLKQYPNVKGVIHAFSGSAFEAETYVSAGFKLGIGGTITYPRANKTIKAIQAVGLENLLLETDAPAMPLNGKQGARNSPEYLPDVAHCLSKILHTDPADIASTTSQTFKALFLKENH